MSEDATLRKNGFCFMPLLISVNTLFISVTALASCTLVQLFSLNNHSNV
jgi:hypothetical protein